MINCQSTPPAAHLVLEGFYVFARHVRIIAAVQNEDLAADVLGVGRGRRVQAAVEADHARDVGAAAGKFQHAGAAETVADGRHPLGITQWIAAERVESRLHARPHERAILLVDGRLDARLPGRLGPDAAAINVRREGHVAHLGELSGSHLHEVAQPHPLVNHQYAGPLCLLGIIPGQITLQDGVSLLVLDHFRLHRGIGHADLHQNDRSRNKNPHGNLPQVRTGGKITCLLGLPSS